MIASMTAFARDAAQGEWGHATWEVRSINHRYLDLSFKIPDIFREWEQNWRHLAAKRLNRGKVDFYLTYYSSQQTVSQYQLNQGLVEQLVSNCQAVMQHSVVSPTIQATELLRWPEVLIQQHRDLSMLKSPLTELLGVALDKLVESRLREGDSIAAFLLAKLDQISTHVANARKHLPVCLQAQRQKMTQRLSEIQTSMDPQRLEQELVYYAQRMDVEEEMERLDTHVKEATRVIQQGGAAGRRLDFLMQELGREANTLSSKSLSTDVTQEAIELKVLIEQMREQIQNVE